LTAVSVGLTAPFNGAVGRIDVLVELLVVGDVGAVFDRQAVFEIIARWWLSPVWTSAPGDIERGAAKANGEVTVRRERSGRIEDGVAGGDVPLRGVAAVGRCRSSWKYS